MSKLGYVLFVPDPSVFEVSMLMQYGVPFANMNGVKSKYTHVFVVERDASGTTVVEVTRGLLNAVLGVPEPNAPVCAYRDAVRLPAGAPFLLRWNPALWRGLPLPMKDCARAGLGPYIWLLDPA